MNRKRREHIQKMLAFFLSPPLCKMKRLEREKENSREYCKHINGSQSWTITVFALICKRGNSFFFQSLSLQSLCSERVGREKKHRSGIEQCILKVTDGCWKGHKGFFSSHWMNGLNEDYLYVPCMDSSNLAILFGKWRSAEEFTGSLLGTGRNIWNFEPYHGHSHGYHHFPIWKKMILSNWYIYNLQVMKEQ